MTPNQIVNAYRYINDLSASVFPYTVTRDIVRLKRRIKDEFDTILSTEQGMVVKYNGLINKDGTYSFPDGEAAMQFAEEYEEFRGQDEDIALPTVDLSKYAASIRISAAAVEALDGLVIFEGDNNG